VNVEIVNHLNPTREGGCDRDEEKGEEGSSKRRKEEEVNA